jgi:hypothetical protein
MPGFPPSPALALPPLLTLALPPLLTLALPPPPAVALDPPCAKAPAALKEPALPVVLLPAAPEAPKAPDMPTLLGVPAVPFAVPLGVPVTDESCAEQALNASIGSKEQKQVK